MSERILTVYRVETGEITGVVRVHGDAVAVPDDCACIRAEIDGDKYYIVDGEPVEYPPRPHPFANFDYATGQWIDDRSLDQIRDEAKAKVIAWASATLSQFTTGYPPEEVLSWSAKLPAARRVLAGEREPMIEIEAKALGVAPTALAAKIAQKGGQYEAIVALASAIRSKTHAAIDAATTPAQIDAVLAAALAEATATLASLGVASGQ